MQPKEFFGWLCKSQQDATFCLFLIRNLFFLRDKNLSHSQSLIKNTYFRIKEVPVTLSWNVKNAKSVSLENETVPLVGKKVVTTDKEKRYVLEVEDEFGTKQVPLTIKTIPLPQIKTVLLPLPKLEKTIQVQHNIPAPKVELNVQMQELSVDMQGVNVNLNPAAIKFAKLNSLHPLSIKIGSSLRSRIKTAIDIITNKVEHLKFESDEK